jgi:hexosaminidase
MYMPRMTALAEVLWTNHKDYDSYLRRLKQHYGRLDVLNVHYRLPDLTGFLSSNVFIDKDTLRIGKPLDGLTIRYTTDATAPTISSTILDMPLVIGQPEKIRVAAFRADGSRGDVYDVQYQQQALAEPETAATLTNGLLCKQYKGMFRRVAGIPVTKPDAIFNAPSIEVPEAAESPDRPGWP